MLLDTTLIVIGEMQEQIENCFLIFWNLFCKEWDLGLFKFSAFGIFVISVLVSFAGLILKGVFLDD